MLLLGFDPRSFGLKAWRSSNWATVALWKRELIKRIHWSCFIECKSVIITSLFIRFCAIAFISVIVSCGFWAAWIALDIVAMALLNFFASVTYLRSYACWSDFSKSIRDIFNICRNVAWFISVMFILVDWMLLTLISLSAFYICRITQSLILV